MSEKYDVAVIGSGSGGSEAALLVAEKGSKAILIEKDAMLLLWRSRAASRPANSNDCFWFTRASLWRFSAVPQNFVETERSSRLREYTFRTPPSLTRRRSGANFAHSVQWDYVNVSATPRKSLDVCVLQNHVNRRLCFGIGDEYIKLYTMLPSPVSSLLKPVESTRGLDNTDLRQCGRAVNSGLCQVNL
jgi:glycine/D-amino acid oxidase-like deaminating enzyme